MPFQLNEAAISSAETSWPTHTKHTRHVLIGLLVAQFVLGYAPLEAHARASCDAARTHPPIRASVCFICILFLAGAWTPANDVTSLVLGSTLSIALCVLGASLCLLSLGSWWGSAEIRRRWIVTLFVFLFLLMFVEIFFFAMYAQTVKTHGVEQSEHQGGRTFRAALDATIVREAFEDQHNWVGVQHQLGCCGYDAKSAFDPSKRAFLHTFDLNCARELELDELIASNADVYSVEAAQAFRANGTSPYFCRDVMFAQAHDAMGVVGVLFGALLLLHLSTASTTWRLWTSYDASVRKNRAALKYKFSTININDVSGGMLKKYTSGETYDALFKHRDKAERALTDVVSVAGAFSYHDTDGVLVSKPPPIRAASSASSVSSASWASNSPRGGTANPFFASSSAKSSLSSFGSFERGVAHPVRTVDDPPPALPPRRPDVVPEEATELSDAELAARGAEWDDVE